ncbi:MAG: CotH kinase family protein, partial [Oscillospiraceae bacterium]
ARVPSGSESFAVCTPSALAENSEENICKPAAPEFSKQSGSFSAAFQLTLSAEDGAKIYYTTDGSTPTEASTEYSGAITVKNRTSEPNVLSAIDRSKFTDWYSGGWGNTTPSKPTVNVDKGTVIRAIAVKDGKSSEVSTVSYFVGIGNKTYDNVPIISIVTDSDNLFDPETGIYMKNNASNKGKEWERPVHIDFIENETVQLSQDCGMRIQGGYSRGDYQKSLRFYARGSYGADKFDYPIISGIKSNDGEGREVNDFEKFVLRNGGNDANYTKFKDSMLQSLVSDMKISTQEGRACIAFINGEYWGVYTLQEDYTDSYVKDHYDVKKKNVVIIKPDTENNNAPKVDEGNDEDVTLWTDDMDWIYGADLSKEDQYKTFTEKFDPESLADYFAVEIYITNEDWSGKNWTVWRSREAEEANPDYSDCRWRFMLYDTEMGANLWGNAGECSTNNKLVQIYQAGRKYNDPVAVLFYKAMQNPQFVSLFKNSMNTAAKAYSGENYKAALAKYKAQYYNNLEKYYQRFPTGNGMWTADQGIKWMNDFFLGSSPREKYYTVMMESLDLIQKYDTLNTAKYTAESVSDLKKAYDSLITTTTRTGTSQSSQQSKIDAFNQAFHGLTLKSDPTSGHTPSSVWTIDKTATCTRTGSKSRHCTVCGAKTNVTTIPKKAHTYKITIVAPTYEEQGYTLHKCSVCGSSY